FEEETLEGIVETLNQTFLQVTEQNAGQEEDGKNDLLVDTMKEMIETNYTDMGMSLQMIADHLGMSDQYIGRQFKKITGISVSEYLNEVRLNNSLLLLA